MTESERLTAEIKSLMDECEEEARSQGFEGDDWTPTPADLEWVADRVGCGLGRFPTVAEWKDAGYEVFENHDYCEC